MGSSTFHIKTLDFESSVKVKFLQVWPQFLAKDQEMRELQYNWFILHNDLSSLRTSTELSKFSLFAVINHTRQTNG